MQKILSVFVFLFLFTTCWAQHAEAEKAIKMTINKLFLGMRNGDSSMVRQSFSKDVTLATIYRGKSGEAVIHRSSLLQDFLRAVGKPHSEIWQEEYWNLKILVDGDFASAWCDYAFYLDKQFSHCGVNGFHFIREKGEWKIFHLADTRRKEYCVVPPEVQEKYK